MATKISFNLIDTAKAAKFLGVKKNTLEVWRALGKGPIFRKIGKLVRYNEADLIRYVNNAACKNTIDGWERQRTN